MQRPILTVSEINRYIKDILSNNIILSNVLIKGEISNYKNHYSGHMYFTLKDEGASIKCVMFKSQCMNIRFEPQDGMKVLIKGRVSVYERDGNYQIYVDDMQPDGIGALHLAFEQLKAKLENEGFFDELRKKTLPMLPKAVGVVTSPTGAALRDMLNILNRRFKGMEIVIFPVQVQGKGAAQQVSNAIDQINEKNLVDVIIVGRGGGSIEELWAFNEEVVARSIFNSKIPIISAVGHETDFTIADFVADLRAPTPSAAAELVVPNKIDLDNTITVLSNRILYSIQNIIDLHKSNLQRLVSGSAFKQPMDKLYQLRLQLDSLDKHLTKEIKYKLDNEKAIALKLIEKLSILSPLNVLKRGYVISTDDNGQIIRSIKDINNGNKIKLQYSDGFAECSVLSTVKGGDING